MQCLGSHRCSGRRQRSRVSLRCASAIGACHIEPRGDALVGVLARVGTVCCTSPCTPPCCAQRTPCPICLAQPAPCHHHHHHRQRRRQRHLGAPGTGHAGARGAPPRAGGQRVPPGSAVEAAPQASHRRCAALPPAPLCTGGGKGAAAVASRFARHRAGKRLRALSGEYPRPPVHPHCSLLAAIPPHTQACACCCAWAATWRPRC